MNLVQIMWTMIYSVEKNTHVKSSIHQANEIDGFQGGAHIDEHWLIDVLNHIHIL